MLRSAGIGGDVGQVDLGLLRRGQLDLGFFSCLFETLKRQRIIVQVHTGLFLELVGQIVNQTQVKVLTPEKRITIGREHLEGVLAIRLGDFDDRNIKRAASQIVNRDRGVTGLLVHSISQRCRGRLIDDSLHLKAGDLARIFGCLTLGIVEIGRDCDYRFFDLFTEIILGGLLHLLQHLRRNLWWRHFVAVDLDPCVAVIVGHDRVGNHLDVFLHDIIFELTPDQPFDGEQCVIRIGDSLSFRRLAHQGLPLIGVGDNRRSRSITLCIFNDLGLSTVQHCDAGIGGPQIDTDYLAHCYDLQLSVLAGLRFAGCSCVLNIWPSPAKSRWSGKISLITLTPHQGRFPTDLMRATRHVGCFLPSSSSPENRLPC